MDAGCAVPILKDKPRKIPCARSLTALPGSGAACLYWLFGIVQCFQRAIPGQQLAAWLKVRTGHQVLGVLVPGSTPLPTGVTS